MLWGNEITLALFHSELGQKQPHGFLSLLARPKAQLDRALERIERAQADILILGDIDYDARLHGVALLQERLSARGMSFPHFAAPRPNSARLLSDGREIGFGFFPGSKGLVVLSKWPLRIETRFEDVLWRDILGHLAQGSEGSLPLVSLSQYVVEITHPEAPLLLGVGHMSAPIVDVYGDRNIRRNQDELALWSAYLHKGSRLDALALLANNDPQKGEGLKSALHGLIHDPYWHQIEPTGCMTSAKCGSITSNWPDPVPGPLRTDYLLVRRELPITKAQLIWGAADEEESRHALVQMRISWP